MSTQVVQPRQSTSISETCETLRLWPMIGAALLAVFVISLPNLLDPMIRHDDYPAYFADGAAFWKKTLNEGRWVNYVWHLRGIVTPAWLNFAVYQALWAIFAACLAVAAMGKRGPTWFTGALVLMILVAPPATLISLWFNTLLPGLALVALYAFLGCKLTPQAHRAILPAFVVLTFMAYTMYPLLLLAVCLARTEKGTIIDLVGLLTLFVLSFAAAVFVTYAINWQVHGVFGVPLAEWREANPAKDLAGLLENLPVVYASFGEFLAKTSFGFIPATVFHLAMLASATLVLLRRAPLHALYLHAGLWMGMSLVVVQILKLGVTVPPRAFIFAWVFYAIIVVRAVEILSTRPGLAGRMGRNFVVLIVASYLLQTGMQYNEYRGWQSETRKIADRVSGTRGPVLLTGDPMQVTSARKAHLQTNLALVHRLQQLAELELVLCTRTPEKCDSLSRTLASSGDDPLLQLSVVRQPGATVIQLP